MKQGVSMIANVHGGNHWVYAYSCAGNNVVNVEDPGYPDKTYPMSGIVDWGMLKVSGGGLDLLMDNAESKPWRLVYPTPNIEEHRLLFNQPVVVAVPKPRHFD